MLQENYDIVCITESWLNTVERDYLAEYSVPGYIMFEKSRTNRNGGGVLLFVKENLNPISLSKPQIPNIDISYILLRNNKGSKIILTLLYRPPAQSVPIDRQLYEQLAELCDNHDTVILGDFNLAVTEWGNNLTSHTGQDLYSNLQESSLIQFVHSPTRGTNILDLVFATKEDLVEDLCVGSEFSDSDHRLVTFKIKFNADTINNSCELVPNFKKANFKKLKTILKETDWSNMKNDNVNIAWDFFTTIYSKAINACIPRKQRCPVLNPKPKWWNIVKKT